MAAMRAAYTKAEEEFAPRSTEFPQINIASIVAVKEIVSDFAVKEVEPIMEK